MLEMAEERGQLVSTGQPLNVRLSQRELTELTGMARGTVARVLSDFRQAGYVRVAGGRITILEPTILAHRTAQP
jgi:CRP-like cAMP-binding protein